MSISAPNRIAAGKSTGGQFTYKTHGEQDIDLPECETDDYVEVAEETPAAGYRRKIDTMIDALSDQDLLASLDTMDAKKNRSESEQFVFDKLNAEHRRRCTEAAEDTPTSVLQEVADRGTSGILNQIEDNHRSSAREELLRRGAVPEQEEAVPEPPAAGGYIRQRADTDPEFARKLETVRSINRIKAAATTVEMGEALQSVLGDRGVVSGFDTPKIDLERTRDIAVTAARLFSKYPQVNSNVTILPIKDSKVTAMATAQRRRGTTKCFNLDMKISSGKLKANSKVNEHFADAKAHGWYHAVNEDVTPMQYAVTHEFGHLLEYSAPLNLYATQKEYVVSKGYISIFQAEANRHLKENSSRYGHTSDGELMAEAFADTELNGKDAFEYSQAIHKAMVGELNARS